MTRNEELPWAGPPKAHLRWPAMLLGVFGTSVGLLFVALGVYALLDYSSANQEVELESPSNTHPEDFTRTGVKGQAKIRALEWQTGTRLTPEKSTPAADEAVPIADGTTTSAAGEAQRHAKSKQRTFVAQARDVQRMLDECDQEISLWGNTILPLLDNDLGKRIAADDALLLGFRAEYSRERPNSEWAGTLRTSLTDLVAPIKAALDDELDNRIPKAETIDELNRLKTEIKNLRDALRGPRQSIVAIVDSAKALPMGDKTLRQTLEEVQNAELLAQTQERGVKVTKAGQDAARRKAEADAKLLKDAADAEIARKEAEAEKERLIAKAQTDEVRRYLAPFLKKGYVQPMGEQGMVGFQKSAKFEPVSYSRIARTGALEPTMTGLKALNQIAAEHGSGWIQNDRTPRWHFSLIAETWSTSDQEYIQHTQDLLRELGPTLKDLGMLAE